MGPVSLLGFTMLTRLTYVSQMKAYQNRPIITEDREGLCAPPRYFVQGGIPAARLTVRLPSTGRYLFHVEARGRAGRFCSGRLDTTLRKGVAQITLPMSHRGRSAVRPRDIRWPVTVHQILVRSFEERDTKPVWADFWEGDPLATITQTDTLPAGLR
jgi:hypothetical protein